MDIKQRADRAKALLADPLLAEALSVIEQEQIDVFANAASTSDEIMEAHRMVRALRSLRERLAVAIVDAKMLEKREKRKGQHRG